MKVLVTGANGFVGKAIVRKLSEADYDVWGIFRANSKAKIGEPQVGRDYFVDIQDEKGFEKISQIGKIDAVIHSAGLAHQFGNVSEEDFMNVNVLGTKNVVDWAAKLSAKHFVLISSVSVYGNVAVDLDDVKGIDENSLCKPKGFYAESKLKAEKICKEICLQNKIPLTILRLATVVGEEDKGNFLRLIRSIDKRRFIWVGKGENQKSIVYKDDVARVCKTVLSGKNPSGLSIYNVSARAIEVREIVKVIYEVLGKKEMMFSIPATHLKSFLSYSNKLIKSEKISKLLETIEKWLAEDVYPADKLIKDHKFKFKVSPEEAIRREVSWYQKQ